MSSLLEAALNYAHLGWPVIPLHTPSDNGCSCGDPDCDHIGKHPRIRGWQQKASTDERQIRSWWRKWPNANIGILTGRRSGLLVLDEDASDAAEQAGGVDDTPAVQTGSGIHYYLAHPDLDLNNEVNVLTGLDIRTDGGLVVAPPSRHANGRSYAWLRAPVIPLADPPDWLIETLQTAVADAAPFETARTPALSPSDPSPHPSQGGVVAYGVAAYIAAALDREVERVRAAGPGNRNDQLNRSAFALGTLVGGGDLDEQIAVDALMGAALSAGLSAPEARRTIRSGLGAGKLKPRRPEAARAPEQTTPAPASADEVQHRYHASYYTRERPAILDESFVLHCLAEEEFGDAQLLAKLYAGRLLYSYADKAWFVWGGHAWYQDRTDLVLRLVAGQLPRQYLAVAAELSPEVRTQRLADALTNRAVALRKLKRVQSILTFARGLLGIAGDEWDRDPWLMGVTNGVLDLRTGKIREGQPEDYIRTVSPTRWRGLDWPAPRFEQFISEIFDDDSEIAGFLQRLLGYGITGLVVEHIFPVLWGERGRNGKDTLLETLKHVLGDLADTVSTEVLLATNNRGSAQPHIVDLMGRRLVWASETDANARLNAAQVKLITGGGTIKTRQLYSAMVEFKPTHLVMLITNFKPKTSAEDEALWRRVLLLPFVVQFVDNPSAPYQRQRDPHLAQKLSDERSGILAWLVRGCLAWQREGLDVPDSVRASTAAYREEVDAIGQFIDECLIVHPDAQAKASAIYHLYREWCEEGGMTPLNQMNFGNLMTKRFERKRNKHHFAYLGVGLRDEQHGDPGDRGDPLLHKVIHEEGNMEKVFAKGDHPDHPDHLPPPGEDDHQGVGGGQEGAGVGEPRVRAAEMNGAASAATTQMHEEIDDPDARALRWQARYHQMRKK